MSVFDNFIDQNHMMGQTNAELAAASGVSPEDAGRMYTQSKDRGVPFGYTGTITPQDRVRLQYQKERGLTATNTGFDKMMAKGPGFAAVTFDRLEEGRNIEKLAAWFGGEGGDPTGRFWKANRNSFARGIASLANANPFNGNAYGMLQSRDEIMAMKRTKMLLDQGKTAAEVFADEGIPPEEARARFERNYDARLKYLEGKMRSSAAKAGAVNALRRYFPKGHEMDAVDDAKTLSEAVSAVFEHPVQYLANTTGEGLIASSPMLIGTALTGGAGAFPAVIGGTISGGIDFGAGVIDRMGELGIDTTDANAMTDFLVNDPRAQEVIDKARLHAIPVGAGDALTMGLAGKTVKSLADLAAPSLRTRVPRAVAFVENALENPYKAAAAKYLVQSQADALLGAGGEAGGQLLADKGITSWSDIVAEYVGGYSTAPFEIAATAKKARLTAFLERSRAEQKAKAIGGFLNAVTDSEIAKRSPEAMDDLVTAIEEAHPDAAEVALDVRGFNQRLRKSRVGEAVAGTADPGKADPIANQAYENLLSNFPDDLATRFREAERTGVHVSLSLKELAQMARTMKDMGINFDETIVPNVHSLGEPTVVEAQEAADSIPKDTEAAVLKEAGKRSKEFRDDLSQVVARIHGQLIMGGMEGRNRRGEPNSKPSQENLQATSVIASLVSHMAEDLGVMPSEVWNRFGIAGVLSERDVVMNKDGTLTPVSSRGAAALGGKKAELSDEELSARQAETRGEPGTEGKVYGQFLPDSRTIIRWTTADRSTFLHETGHWFLTARIRAALDLMNSGRELTAPQRRFLQVTEATVKWLGAKNIEEFALWRGEKETAAQERFARTFEDYLRKGEAPTAALGRVFLKFRKWLKDIYGSIAYKKLPGSAGMDPSVQALFDDLFTSSTQVREVAARRALTFLAANDDITPDQLAGSELWKQYVSLLGDAHEEASEDFAARMINANRQIRSLRASVIDRIERRAKEIRAQLTDEEANRISQTRQFRLAAFFHRPFVIVGYRADTDSTKGKGRMPKLDVTHLAVSPDVREALLALGIAADHETPYTTLVQPEYIANTFEYTSVDEMMKDLRGLIPRTVRVQFDEKGKKIGRKTLESLGVAPGAVAELERRGEVGGGKTEKGHLTAGKIAEAWPWAKGREREFIETLAATQSYEEEIKSRVEARMEDEYPEYSSRPLIEEQADIALANSPSLGLGLIAEIRFLESATGYTGAERRLTKELFIRLAQVELAGVNINDIKIKEFRQRASALARQAARLLEKNTAVKNEDFRADPQNPAFAAAASENRRQAALLKRQELFMLCMASEAQKARDRQTRAFKRLRKQFNRKREANGYGAEWLRQIEQILFKLDILTGVGVPNAATDGNAILRSLRTFFGRAGEGEAMEGVESHEASLADIPIPPGLEEALLSEDKKDAAGNAIEKRIAFADMTVAQADMFIEFMNDFMRAARNEREAVMNGKRVEIEAIQNEILQEIDSNVRRRGLPEKGEFDANAVDNLWAGLKSKLKELGIAHLRLHTILSLVTGREDGAAFQWIERFVAACRDRENALQSEKGRELLRVMKPFLDKARKLNKEKKGGAVYYEELHASLTYTQVVAIALNMGNQSNIDRLLRGSDKYPFTQANEYGVKGAWTEEAVRAVIGRVLSEEDLHRVQEAWDVMSSLWEEENRVERENANREIAKIEPKELEVKLPDGKTVRLKGGYYPVAYDSKIGARSSSFSLKDQALSSIRSAIGKQSTRASAARDRRGSGAADSAIALTFEAGFNTLSEVIHDVCWRTQLANMEKIFDRKGPLAQKIAKHFGVAYVNAVHDWINDVASEGRQNRETAAAISRFMRQNVSVISMGFNIMTSLVQPIGIVQTYAHLGREWTNAGLREFLRNPAEARRFAENKSAMMRNRALTQMRDIAEVQGVVTGRIGEARQTVLNWAFKPIAITQMLVDVPTWMGAYQKALAEGRTDAEAVALADQEVTTAQGSGSVSDLSGLERGGELSKLLTTFYTFFNTALQLGVLTMNNKQGMDRAAAMFLIFVLQPVIESYLKAGIGAGTRGASGGDDDDDWIWEATKGLPRDIIGFQMGLLVGVREMQNAVTSPQFGYSGPAAWRTLKDANKFLADLGQGKFNASLAKEAVTLAGAASGIVPVVPINRAIGAFNEDDATPLAYLFGYQRK